MLKESKYCSDVVKKHFNKELAVTKTDDKNFRNSAKCLTCDNYYIDGDVKVRYHCHISGTYGGSAHKDCDIMAKLNHNLLLYSTTKKKTDSHLAILEVGKLDYKINTVRN